MPTEQAVQNRQDGSRAVVVNRAGQGVPVNVGVLYTVRPAESLFDLAARFYTTGSRPAFTPLALIYRTESGK